MGASKTCVVEWVVVVMSYPSSYRYILQESLKSISSGVDAWRCLVYCQHIERRLVPGALAEAVVQHVFH